MDLRKHHIYYPFLFTALITAAGILIFLFFVQYPQMQGFNPSDDGVILAQSFRMLNGEVPHADFIAIRPVFSGVLHTINYAFPGPLVMNGRWFVILEYLLISLIFAFIMVQNIIQNGTFLRMLVFIPLTILAFWMSGIKFMLFPWTTIDALLFCSAGLLLMYSTVRRSTNVLSSSQVIASLTFFALGALCRQSFFLIYLFASAWFILYFYRQGKLKIGFFLIFSSSIPFVFYALYLVYHHAFGEFLQQMSSQTSLYEIAVLRYFNALYESPFSLLHGLIALYSFIFLVLSKVLNKNFFVSETVSILYILFILWLGIDLAQGDFGFVQQKGFELFWSVLILSCVSYTSKKIDKKETMLIAFIILISWVSSISVGNNSLIFTSGILFLTILLLFIKNISPILKSSWFSFSGIFLFAAYAGFIFYYSYQSQKEFNYRDLPQDKLTHELNFFSAFGDIRTSEGMYNYLNELRHILDSFDDIQDHFVSIPNNAIIYPVTNSKNPLSLDWLQPAEYSGQEDHLLRSIKRAVETEKTYFILEKVDSKRIYRCRCTEVHSEYEYVQHIRSTCYEVMETESFWVFCSRSGKLQ